MVGYVGGDSFLSLGHFGESFFNNFNSYDDLKEIVDYLLENLKIKTKSLNSAPLTSHSLY